MTIVVQKKYEVYEDERETSQDMKQDSKQDIGCGDGNCQEGSSVKIVLENYTINVFFDGTGNNVHNTEFRLLDEEYAALQKKRQFYKKELAESAAQDIKINALTERNGKTYITQRRPNLRERIQEEQRLAKEQAQLKKRISDIENEMDRLIDEKEYANHAYLRNQVSYMNEFSNVALLHLSSKDTSTKYSNIYIEGAGTSKTDLDNTDGLGFAQGDTGVYARINLAFQKINSAIRKNNSNRYTVNVFGFSRGSFYARVFCAWLKSKTDKSNFEGEGYSTFNALQMSWRELEEDAKHRNRRYEFLKEPAENFTINLVGIYDTVSSYGMFTHYSNPKEFPLDITPHKQGIVKLVHFTAQNEYRQHFPLTKIRAALDEVLARNDDMENASQIDSFGSHSKKDTGSAIELSFPGAHSNIGGAYTDIWVEEDHYLSILDPKSKQPRHHGEIHWKWWVDKGYYLKDLELKINNEWVGKKQKLSYLATRGVRNHYQYIMFEAMKKVIKKFAKIITFNDEEERVKERLDILEKVKKGIEPNESLANLYRKNIAEEKRGEILKKISEKIDEFLKKHLDKSGSFEFDLEEAITSEDERKTLYNTYICNSLQPIGYFSLGKDKSDVYIEDYVAPEAKNKYDLYPQKETETILSTTIPGVANEGNMNNQEIRNGIFTAIRPIVQGG